jgi:diadenosine tetraphosphatase ApaH/serine/threonine PP2A family protein phosphatase
VRVAIVSDIHGNRHAFEAVLDDARAAGAEQVWCLGDLVGYGGDPGACVALAREHVAVCLAGNHDLAVTGELGTEEFSPAAAASARWTRQALADEDVAYLRALRSAGVAGGWGLYHASPRDPVWEYVLSEPAADACLDVQAERICLIGHSHVALAFVRHAGEPARGALCEPGTTADLHEASWLLNPGSVGQPRDGDPRAAWLLLDTEARRATWQRTAYDIAGAQSAIRQAGLPESLAERLGYGQ